MKTVEDVKGVIYFMEKLKYNYFIIHGSFGNPFVNWFSWLHDFIEDNGKQVSICTTISNRSRISKL